MNTTEFLASLESLATMGLDELNYDSIWHHSDAAHDMKQEELVAEEEEAEEVVADEDVGDEEEVVEVTEASTRPRGWIW